MMTFILRLHPAISDKSGFGIIFAKFLDLADSDSVQIQLWQLQCMMTVYT